MDNRNNQIPLSGFIIALSGAILFSTKAIFVKLAFNAVHVDAVTLLTLRMLFSLPFYIIAVFIAQQKESAVTLTLKQWLSIALMGILGYYLSSLFDFIGLQYVSAGLERLILFLYPTFAVLINTFFFRTKLSTVQIIALLLTYAGIGIAYVGEMKIDTSNPNFFLRLVYGFSLCCYLFILYCWYRKNC